MRRCIKPEPGKLRMAVLCLALLLACALVSALPLLPVATLDLPGQPGQENKLGKKSQDALPTTSPSALLACSWTEPVMGNTKSMIFTGDCLLACKPGTLVHMSAKLAERDAVLRCARQAEAGKGRHGTGLDLVVPEGEGPHFFTLELTQGGHVHRMLVCLYVPHQATLSKGRFGKLTVGQRFLGTYHDPATSGVEKVREHPRAYQPPTQYLRITDRTAPLLVSSQLRLGDLVVPDRKTGKRHTDLVPVNYRLLAGIQAFLGACRARGLGGVRFLSVYRTPIHNHSVGSGTFSQHKYMNAIDFIMDADHDGQMDDFTHDGKIDRRDGLWLVALIEELQAGGVLPIGGIGIYTFKTSDYRLTMHLDFRGHRARWAYAHDRRGRRHPFAWKSIYFAKQDQAEKARHPDRWQEPEYELPGW